MVLGTLGFVALLLGVYGFAFGATRLLLRRTAWNQYSFEAPLLAGPALAILVLSVFGYHDPDALPPWQAWLLLLGGWALSLAVSIWDRQELWTLARTNCRRCLIVTAPALVAAGVLIWFFGGNIWDTIRVPWINEYLDYAELAAVLTGHHQGEVGTLVSPFCEFHHKLRYGQDLPVAALAQITGLHPIQTILPWAVLFRFQQAIVLGLLVCGMAKSLSQWKAILAILLLDALLLTETFFFGASFFSSNCTMPLFAVYFVWLACQQQFGWRECIVVVLMNLFFLITYPEFLAIAKLLEVLSIGIAWWRGNRQHWLPLVACTSIFVAMHPWAIVAKAELMAAHLGRGGGWNAFGDPVHQPLHFLSSLLGLRYGHLPMDPLRNVPILTWIVLGSAVALIAVGLLRLARIYRVTWLLLAWTALLVATHVGSNIKYGNYYAGVKFLSHTYFLLVLAAAATLLTTSVRWQRIGLAGLVMWLLAAGFSSERLLRHIRHNGYSISFAQTGESIQTIAGEQNVAVLSEARHPLHLVNLVAGQRGLKVAAIAPDQRDAINLIKLCQVMDCTQVAADGVIFDGVIVTDRTVFQDGQCFLGQSLLLLSPRRVLGQAGQLVFCEGRIELATAASFPRYHWVWEGCSRTPTLYAHSRHLRLAGEVSEFHPLPYRFTCNVPEMNWSRDVVVDKKGEFDVVLEMPEAIIGQTIAVEFKNYGTFRPAERNPNSPDARELGFMLLGAGFEKQHR